MSEASTIEMATRRLAAALDGLEAALDRRRAVDGREAALSAQMAILGLDRSRLAAELDDQTARALQLETTTREISRRLDAAMDTIRQVVDQQGA